jgi:hypothetical protein
MPIWLVPAFQTEQSSVFHRASVNGYGRTLTQRHWRALVRADARLLMDRSSRGTFLADAAGFLLLLRERMEYLGLRRGYR